jgi:hypothetical protein
VQKARRKQVLCNREGELLQNYLAQVDLLNETVQRHFSAINAGDFEGTSKERYEKQVHAVRQAYKRLIDHREEHGCRPNVSTWLTAGEHIG